MDGPYEPSLEDWGAIDEADAGQYYAQVQSDYFHIVDDYLIQANAAATRYRESIISFGRWRFWIIMATGALATINVCAALQIFRFHQRGGA
jgi:hypothetical protein